MAKDNTHPNYKGTWMDLRGGIGFMALNTDPFFQFPQKEKDLAFKKTYKPVPKGTAMSFYTN